MQGGDAARIGGGICVAVIVTSIILVAMSFSTLHATEWGLAYNQLTERVAPDVFDAGLHFIGPFTSFIRFPNTYQNMQFSTSDDDLLHTRTSDGLPLTLGISFQFTLMKAQLYDLYMSYREDYRWALFNVATHIIADTASNYTAYNFFNDKQTIAYSMQDSLNHYVSSNLHMNVETLQIILVELPQLFEDAILESISVKQNITRMEKAKQNMMVTFQTQIMAAKQQANQTVALAQGTSQQILAQQNAESTVLTQNVDAEVNAYTKIKDQLALEGTSLLEYVWWDSIADQQGNSEFIVGVNPAAMINNRP